MTAPVDTTSMPTTGISDMAERAPFWQSRLLWSMLAVGSLLPFLVTTILPFNDLPNHVGRHYIFLNAAHDSFLARFYDVHWSIIGNLGVDIIVRLIGPWLGADLATHVTVALIPPLTIAGIYSLSRALNGEVTPSALLSTTLSLNWPLITGFANFCLSAAIALLVLALWIRLRAVSYFWRLCIFVPLVFVTWLAHTAGWGLLGLGIVAYEMSRAVTGGLNLKRLMLVPLQLIVFLPTLIFIILWRQHASNGAAIKIGQDFWRSKAISIFSLFREHFIAWDVMSALLFFALIVFFYWRGGRKFIWPAACIAVTYLIAFLLCPQEVFKSGFADRRLLTYAAILVPLAIGLAPDALGDPVRRRAVNMAAIACIALFAGRIAVSSVVWRDASRLHEARLALIDQVPLHSRIFGLVVESCGQSWNRIGRPDHIQQYAIVRRDSMVNGIYQNPGLNQVEAKYEDPSAIVDPNMYAVVHDQSCPVSYIRQSLQSAMLNFPRDKFDYVWLIGEQPLNPYDDKLLKLVGIRDNDRLYQVIHIEH